MSMRNKVVTAGVVGLVLALGLIVGSTYLVQSPNQTTASNSTVTSTLTLTQTLTTGAASQSQTQSVQASQSQSQSSQSTQSATSQSQTSQSSPSPSGGGTVDVLLTDPPTLPAGVTAVYVTYRNVAVHVSGAGSQSGWTNSNTTGTLNLVKLVNVSSTIATIKVSSGVYNELRFNISSAAVTYNSKNYTAFVQGAEITIPIPGGIPVNASNSSAAIIDMHPTVVNIGSNSTPEFIISTSASGYCIPSKSVTGNMGQQGNQINLVTSGWWQQISENSTANIRIGGATLTPDSFSVTVANTGTAPVNLTALFVAPLGNECPTSVTTTTASSTSSSTSSQTSTSTTSQTSSTSKSGHGGGGNQVIVIPACLTGSDNFIVLDNGTIVPINPSLPISPVPIAAPASASWGLFGKTGYTLGVGETVTLTYSGSIVFGLVQPHSGQSPPGVIPGDQYDITVVGQQALAATIVVAT